MKDTVAILMATYNGEKYLRQQLDSLLEQTYQDFTIYISDDCSADETVAIIQEYSSHFPEKIVYISNEQNCGLVNNFEKLLNACDEEYMAFCDQDDIWHSKKLEVLMDAIVQMKQRHPNAALLVHSDLCLIDQDGKIVHNSYFQFRKYKLKQSKDIGHILGPCGVMGNTMLINKELKELALPFPAYLDIHDYWIALQAELFGKRKTLHTQLVKYRIHNNNYSNNTKSLLRKINKIKYLKRNTHLPYMQTNRRVFLLQILPKVTDKNDRKTVEVFLEYLNFNTPKLKIYYNLIKHSLVKRDLLFRIKLLFKILLTKRYNV